MCAAIDDRSWRMPSFVCDLTSFHVHRFLSSVHAVPTQSLIFAGVSALMCGIVSTVRYEVSDTASNDTPSIELKGIPQSCKIVWALPYAKQKQKQKCIITPRFTPFCGFHPLYTNKNNSDFIFVGPQLKTYLQQKWVSFLLAFLAYKNENNFEESMTY